MNAQARPVEIAVRLFGGLKIEQVGFDRRPRADGGAHADVGDARPRARGAPGPIRADRRARRRRRGGGELGDAPQVGRRKPNGSPALIAADHRPVSAWGRPRPHHVGQIARSRRRGAPGCSTTGPCSSPTMLGGAAAKPSSSPSFFERRRDRPPAPGRNENSAPTTHDCAELLDQHLRARNCSGVNCGERVVERFDHHANGRDRCRDELDLALERRQKPRAASARERRPAEGRT